jgi:hypothetical protein
MYYKIYGEELPLRNYKQQDIDYIIEQLYFHGYEEDEGVLNSHIVH